MTKMRTPIRCQCGHGGYIIVDVGIQGRRYSLDGFEGAPLDVASQADMPESLLGTLAPRCPQCGQVGSARYAPEEAPGPSENSGRGEG